MAESSLRWVGMAGVALLAGVVGLGAGALLMRSGGGEASPSDAGAAGGDAAAAAAAPAEAPRVPPATVRVGKATQETLQARFEVIGRLQEVQRATVAAEVRGKIIEVPVEEGTRVEAGKTVLAKIDPIWMQAELEAAEARVASAEATLEQSQRDLDYLTTLAQANSAKPKEVDDARAQVNADKASLDAAIAERHAAASSVERLTVLAPFDGVVIDKRAEVGQWVEPGDPVHELVSVERIDAVVDVPERVVNQVRVGTEVEVEVEPLQRVVTGHVIAVIPSGMSAARTFPVKVRLSDEDGLLKPGMSVIARLPMGEAGEKLTVPRDAVLFSGAKATVWAAVPMAAAGAPAAEAAAGSAGGPSLQAMPMEVQVLFGEGDRVAVNPLPGQMGMMLAPEMSVVIEGAERLFPTQPLMVIELAQVSPTE